MFSYLVAGGLIILGVYGALRGMPWPLSLLGTALGLAVLVGLGRPLYRIAVYRTSPQEILCRYVPWFQANTVLTSVLFPIIGIATIAQGSQPDSPFWVRYAGYLALMMGVVFAIFAAFMAIRNRLVLTPSALDIQTLQPLRHIPRERVHAIVPRMLPSGVTRKPTLHVDLTYAPDAKDGQSLRTSGLIDTQFTVEAADLLAALQEWKNSGPDDAGLLDRVEAILRGRV